MLVGAVIGTRLFGVLEGGGFEDPSSESARAGDALDRDFDAGEYDLVLVATAAGGDVDAPGRRRGGRGPGGEAGGPARRGAGGVVLEPRLTPTMRSEAAPRHRVGRIHDSQEAAEDDVMGPRRG